MIPITWLKDISYVRREVSVNLHIETIKEAPEFDPGYPIEPDDEKLVIEHYSRDLVIK